VAQGLPEAHVNAWRGVLNAHAAVIDRVERALAEAELPPLAWYDVLWAVRRAPHARVRMAELADGLTVSRGGLTKLADRLERSGLLRREAADDDGRGVYAVLTDDGREMLRRMWRVYSRVLRETIGEALDEREAETVAAALDRTLRRAADVPESETAPALRE
jgi:DNA-binding MarR family transcriptional regulator